MEAEKARLSQKAPNVAFHRGDAEHLPHKASCFDLVTCGHALHHFPLAERVPGGIAWIVKPSGRILIFDSLASEEIEAAILHNRIELLRDLSHRKSLTVSALLARFEPSRQVRRLMLTALDADPAGFSPRREGDAIIIHHGKRFFFCAQPELINSRAHLWQTDSIQNATSR